MVDTASEGVKVVSVEGEVVEFDARFQELSELVQNNDVTEEIPTSVSKDTLLFIRDFCVAHDYSAQSMQYTYPFVSTNLRENVDDKTYEVFERVLKGVHDDVDKSAQILCPILEAAFYLSFKKLMKIANVALQVRFYCPPTEVGIQQFCDKWGITEKDVSGDNRDKIMRENKPVFDAIKRQYQHEMDKLYQEYEEQKRQQQLLQQQQQQQ